MLRVCDMRLMYHEAHFFLSFLSFLFFKKKKKKKSCLSVHQCSRSTATALTYPHLSHRGDTPGGRSLCVRVCVVSESCQR